MKRENYVLAVALVSAICISGYAFVPTVAAVISPIVPSATPSPRKKATPRPIQSPVARRATTNKNIGTGNQVESARTQASPSANRSRTETVDNNETITIHQRKTPTAGNQPGVQQRRRTNTATPKSQPRAVKKNQDIEVENDETHLAPRTSTGSGSATPTQIPAQNVMNKNCQEFESVRNDRTRNQTSGGSTNSGTPKSSVKRSKPRRQ